MKKSVIAFVCLAILFAVPLASAGFWQWITGQATTTMEANVSNTAPIIYNIEAISNQLLILGTSTPVSFTVNAEDNDTYLDLNTSSITVRFISPTGPGNTVRTGSCTAGSNSSINRLPFSCGVTMWYFDEPGVWAVNATIEDLSGAFASGTITFNVSDNTGFEMSPSTIHFPTITPGGANYAASDDPNTLNNTGNHVFPYVKINATDLNGTGVRPDVFIMADAFQASTTGGNECTAGDPLLYHDFKNISSSQLSPGNLSVGDNGKVKIYYCLYPGVLAHANSLSLVKQSYSTGATPWTVMAVA